MADKGVLNIFLCKNCHGQDIQDTVQTHERLFSFIAVNFGVGLTTRLCVVRHCRDPNLCSESLVCSQPPLKPLYCFCHLRSLGSSSHKLCTAFGKATRHLVPCHVGHRSFSVASACPRLSLSIVVTTSPTPCSREGCMVGGE